MMFSLLSIVTVIVPYFVAAQGQPHIFVSSPNIVRVGNRETVLVSVYNSPDLQVTVSLNTIDGSVISSKVVEVNQDNPEIVSLYVDPELVPLPNTALVNGEDVKQYIQVKVECEDLSFLKQEEVLLSYEEGFVFVQTDKPLYTPDQHVSIRIMTLDQYMRPSAEPVQIDILTPQDVIVHRMSNIVAANGFQSRTFRFPHEPLFGNWSVVAYYGPENAVNTSIQFEVKEYVLPTFSVKIHAPDYILEGQEIVDCAVEARYVYKKTVQGAFHAKIGVLHLDGEIEIHTTQRGQIHEGYGHFRISTTDLGDNWFHENLGARLYLEVSVVEPATGYFENATDVSAKFVVSPYIFTWDRTIQYFKKGLPYEIKTDLKYTNGKPAPDIDVQVTATATTTDNQEQLLFGEDEEITQYLRTNSKGQVNFRIFVPTNCERILVELQTVDESLEQEENGRLQFTITSYISPSVDDFLLIRMTEQFVNVDDNLNIEALLNTNDVVPHLSYYVITKGQIVYAGVLNYHINNVQYFSVPITYNMVPSARIVAYYINSNGKVIADSLWMEIFPICENRVSVSIVGSTHSLDTYSPNKNIELQIDALTRTTVGLIAVDKAVLLLRDYHRLSQNKMYSTMDSHDTGCGPGGGRDSPDIFKNVGVIIMSNVDLDVSRREEYACATPTNPRRRRSLSSQRLEYADNPKEDFACRRGHKILKGDNSHLTCQERLTTFWSVVRDRFPQVSLERQDELSTIFIACCADATTIRNRERGRTINLDWQNFDFDDSTINMDDNYRTDFPETWIFEEVEIESNGFARLPYTLPGSITEWSVHAVGLSERYAMCIADPIDILVVSDLFIQLHMPYSVVRMEQVEIVATIYNYGRNHLAVRVYLKTSEKLCSEGNPNEWSASKNIAVYANSAVSVKYVVIPLEVGNHPVKISAVTAGMSDTIEKNLPVVADGIEKSHHYSAILDPSGSQNRRLESGPPSLEGIEDVGSNQQGRIGRNTFRVNEVSNIEEEFQVNVIDVRLPPNAVPGSESCEVSIIGNMLGPVITSIIDGLETLLVLPRGCGEQTMIHMAPNVYILRYLTRVDFDDEVIQAKARSNIEEGILREMTHRHPDGSFSVWGSNPNYPSSTWLTAFVTKVFCHATEFSFVDPKVTCDAISWLLASAQREDGAFIETYQVHHREMTGGLQGDATMTAFVLISIHECECASQSDEIAAATARAVVFLEGELDNLRRPYAIAIVTYALVLVGSSEKSRANALLRDIANDEDNLRYWGADSSSLGNSARPYWYQVRPTAIMVETTGYALLAQLALGDMAYSHAIVSWLSAQQNYGGGFASTQDTVIALQALSEYAMLNDVGDIEMECRIFHADSDYEEIFHLTNENRLVQKHAKPPATGQLLVESRGQGTGKLNVKVKYNVVETEQNREQSAFAIDINAREALDGNLDEHEKLEQEPPTLTVGRGYMNRSRIGRFKRQSPRAEATKGALILNIEIGVRYQRGERTSMAIIDVGIYSGFVPIEADLRQLVQENDYVSRYEVSQRSVILYADFIPAHRVEISFKVRRDMIVGNIQPVVVKVYDYYNPSEESSRFYHPTGDNALLQTICAERTCICAASPCYDCDTKRKDELLSLSCNLASTYAFKIQVLEKKTENGFKIYRCAIVEVFKAGDDRDILVQDTRSFWARSSCSCSKPIKVNSSYLVIGHKYVPYVDESGNDGLKYLIDSSTTVEIWPKRKRSQLNKLEGFKNDMISGRTSCQ